MKSEKILKHIIEDESIMTIIKYKINEIIKDDVVDYNDIPHLIEIVIIVLTNTKKLKLSNQILKNTLKEIIVYILKSNNLINENNKETIDNLIDNSLHLVSLGNKLKRCLWF